MKTNKLDDSLQDYGSCSCRFYQQMEKTLHELQAELDQVNEEWVKAAMALGKAVQEIYELKAENEALKTDNKRLKGFCWETDEAKEFLEAVKKAQEK